ncbi:DoxX family protein [Corynebacterium sp. TAE3-ERU16]|uniref:DoxX family protein n=1 Tax=Corynebacterium sp. TAE3-ERU16 TaxID=2849493 RepID=UPI001C45A10A|nr:DoxX family protein [Corynebacterium sp. TAE3-ERU16]MBV7292819.1 DoxX family membrane protein [Corynebacterium sp. TAE3-ERU16]
MIRKLARPMLASVYIADGVDTLANTEAHVEGTGSVIDRLRGVLPRQYAALVPTDPELVTRGLGVTKVGAGSMLALGKFPRLSALTLAITAIPTILARHAFWEADDSQEKSARRSGFLTSIALLGGLFITTADTQGKPGIAWRTKHAAKVTNKKVQKALPTKSETEKFAETASEQASALAESTRGFFGEATEKASEYIEAAQEYFEDNKDDWLKAAESNAETAKKRAVKLAGQAQERADEARKNASRNAAKYQKEADKAAKKAKKKWGKKLDI